MIVMSDRTKYFLFGCGTALVIVALASFAAYTLLRNSIYIYTASPGFTTHEAYEKFMAKVPKCNGVSLRVRPLRIITDSPGQKICIGNLVEPK